MCVSYTCPFYLFLTHGGHTEEHPAHCTAHSSWAGMSRGSSNTKNWRKVKVPASEMLWNKVSHRAGGIGIGQLNPEIRSKVWASLECRWNRGFCASSHISGLCLCRLAHTACSFLTHTSMARYMLFAPPRSAPEWAALCKCISHLLNSQWDQVVHSSKVGSLFVFTWTITCTINSASYPRNCLFKSGCV